jgi:hypothetical protein
MLPTVSSKSPKRTRPPRIRVPNNERALFVIEADKFVGVIQRLSLTGGSAVLAKGPIPEGTLGKMGLKTVFGNVTAQIQFLHSGADGVPLAQAFRFVDMDEVSWKRFSNAAKQMESAGFSDAGQNGFADLASRGLSKLGESIRRISTIIPSGGAARAKK